jgi:Sulfotransferase domain
MTLKVIGSGLGRTGTKSLKTALEQLGFGPCHHMIEVFMHPESVPLWVEAGHGRADWNAIYKDYRSTVDYPGARFWRELAAAYPDAKILHTVRDPGRWFESTQETIFAPRQFAANPPESMKAFFEVVVDGMREHLHDREFMIAHFKRHTDEVLATIPRDRLLVYQVSEGWEPLCRFLGIPVPNTPFPSENSREEFKARAAAFKPE